MDKLRKTARPSYKNRTSEILWDDRWSRRSSQVSRYCQNQIRNPIGIQEDLTGTASKVLRHPDYAHRNMVEVDMAVSNLTNTLRGCILVHALFLARKSKPLWWSKEIGKQQDLRIIKHTSDFLWDDRWSERSSQVSQVLSKGPKPNGSIKNQNQISFNQKGLTGKGSKALRHTRKGKQWRWSWYSR